MFWRVFPGFPLNSRSLLEVMGNCIDNNFFYNVVGLGESGFPSAKELLEFFTDSLGYPLEVDDITLLIHIVGIVSENGFLHFVP